MKIYKGFHGSFMDTFTGIPECISGKFKWVFMAIFFLGFEHKEYQNVYNKWVFIAISICSEHKEHQMAWFDSF